MSDLRQFGCKTCCKKFMENNFWTKCPICGSEDVDEIISCPYCGRPQYKEDIEAPVDYCHHDI